jgi:peptidoglycan/LPS O-acetylase OafA/YrhL
MSSDRSQTLESGSRTDEPDRGSVSPPSGAPTGRGRDQLRHRDDIQGLRAIAVLLVVLGHAGVGFLRGGYIGVDVFFVLSGFLITGLLIAGAERRGHVSLREFYARRAKRILPAAALTLVVIDIATVYWMTFVRAKQAVVDSLWAAVFSANIHFAHEGANYFDRIGQPSPVQHFWSLAVEEQFYLVWPLLIVLVLAGVGLQHRASRHARGPASEGAAPAIPRLRLAIAIALIGLGSLAWSVYNTPESPSSAYFSTFTRVWELALGAALAIGAAQFTRLPGWARAALGWAGVAAIAVAAVAFSDATRMPGYAALLPTLGAAAVIAAGIGDERSRGAPGGLLGRAPLRYVGDRSYAFYLWHWPFLIIGAAALGHVPPLGTPLSVGMALALMGAAFLVSMASYRWVENPIRRAPLTRPLRTSAVLWGTSVGLVVVVAAVGFGIIGAGTVPPISDEAIARRQVMDAVQLARQGAPIPQGLNPPLDKLLADHLVTPDDVPDCWDIRDDPTWLHQCTLFPDGAKGTIVVIGDSHAYEWLPAIMRMAERDGWSLIPLWHLGCWPPTYIAGGDCQDFVQWAEQQVQAIHPEVVLIGGELRIQSQETMRQTITGLDALITAVKPSAGHVVLIGDPPARGDIFPADCLAADGATLGTCAWTLEPDQIAVYRDSRDLAERDGISFMDTIGWFCVEDLCPSVVGHTVTMRENDHISKTYAELLLERFRAAFNTAVLE